MFFQYSFLFLPFMVSGDIKCSADDRKCSEDQGRDTSSLLQNLVGVHSTIERSGHGKAVHKGEQIPMSTDTIYSKLAEKQGMNANGAVGNDTLNLFTNQSSWFWTYSLEPEDKALAWAQANGKEFVPLVNLKKILPKSYGKCSFKKGTCTVDMLVEVLNKTKQNITTRYLMGYNEPYSAHQEASSYGNKAAKSVNGTEGARWWRLWVQPAAERTNLTLVSPTTGISSQKAEWMKEFLQACYDNKDADPPCTVEKIKVFSIHEYKCYATYWRKYAALDGGDDVEVKNASCTDVSPFKPRSEDNFYTNMKGAMRDKYGDDLADSFWDPYFNSTKLWVTETSCSGDIAWNKKSPQIYGVASKYDLPSTVSAEESCQFITGQSCQRGEGSIAAMLAMDNIERFSWFTLFPNPKLDHPNYESIVAGALINATTAVPKPPGRALLSGLDPVAANCGVAA